MPPSTQSIQNLFWVRRAISAAPRMIAATPPPIPAKCRIRPRAVSGITELFA
jgi:hypothetical protein